jgi:hypothetical protein
LGALAGSNAPGRHRAARVAIAAMLGRALSIDARAIARQLSGLAVTGALALRADHATRARLTAGAAIARIARDVDTTTRTGLKRRATGERASSLDASGIAAGRDGASVPAAAAVAHVTRQIGAADTASRERAGAGEATGALQTYSCAALGRAAGGAAAATILSVVLRVDADA